MPRKAKTAKKTARKLRAITHDAQTRANLPTAEHQALYKEDDAVTSDYPRKHNPGDAPEMYARDPNKDPQLVWRGKDADDKHGILRLTAVPIFVQEKIHPQALIEDLRRRAKRAREAGGEAPLDLFYQNFNGLPDDLARVEFYRHQQRWSNRMILGDSKMVMHSLAHKENLKGRVQCIYMDPPYGIDFNAIAGVGLDEANPELIRAFRDTWRLGIHSYLSYLRDRLTVAKDLLTESGSVFVQISERNVHLVRCIMDEVFGAENFVSLIAYKASSGASQEKAPKRVSDYLVWYAKEKEQVKFRRLYVDKKLGHESTFGSLELPDGSVRPMTNQEKTNPESIPSGAKPFRKLPCHSRGAGAQELRSFNGKEWGIPATRHWTHKPEGFSTLVKSGRVDAGATALSLIYYFHDFAVSEITNTWGDTAAETDTRYVVQTHPLPVQRCILMTTDPGDLVLDPTCGSGTTAFVAEQWGRRWITIDTSKVALTAARTRLMAAKYDYYLMRDSADGAAKEKQLGRPPIAAPGGDIRHGFVCERAPHITLGDIANNRAIDEIHARHQPALESALAKLNAAAGGDWREWQVPATLSDDAAADMRAAHATYRQLRAERQGQIDAAIAAAAKYEELTDKPFDDKTIVRVAGPFTVESLSPHSVVGVDDADAAADKITGEEENFMRAVLENLCTCGVSTADGAVQFTELEVAAGGGRLHFVGRCNAGEQQKRVAVCVGPQYGTVGGELIVAAAGEAADNAFDLLLVLGFAFEGRADQNIVARQIGKLTIIRAHIGNDLHMNLQVKKDDTPFCQVGELDAICRRCEDAEDGDAYQVQLRGMDIWNPKTGEVRGGDTSDIAMWMLDGDYDGISFFVRHAYFCGGGKDPYKALKRALRADIDGDAWAALYATTSRPFPRPKTGKAAVKAINRKGEEVMKVFNLEDGAGG